MLTILFVAALAHASLPIARADVFGSGASSFEVEFATIGNPANPPDTTGSPNPAGSVPYAYRIGKYEVSEQMIEGERLGRAWHYKGHARARQAGHKHQLVRGSAVCELAEHEHRQRAGV
ncbi:MAG TPA: hypothetical protein VJ828_20060 [Lacipirellulaceae bacterium]|nr:hypothetical protein [Lacipirellulaceae bacterium]